MSNNNGHPSTPQLNDRDIDRIVDRIAERAADKLARRYERAIALQTALAYSIDDLILVTGLGKTTLWAEVAKGNLTVRYAGKRAMFLAEDVRAYLNNLPTERPERENTSFPRLAVRGTA